MPLESVGIVVSAEDLALFDFTRMLRNRIVHAAHRRGNLRMAYMGLGRHRREWERLAGRDFLEALADGEIALTLGEAFGVVALARRMGHRVNTQLQLRTSARPREAPSPAFH